MLQENSSLNIKFLLPSVIGNILEWYDFLLYGFFAPILAQLFFPAENKIDSLLATFGVFAIGFLMRPLGSAFFGHFGDKLGRKSMLAISLSLMALSTALIGCLPTYAHIGATAGILLTACRLLQGFALGGEFGYSVFLIEHTAQRNRGLYSGLAIASASLGLLLSSAFATITQNVFDHTQLIAWGWRIPFLLGIILGGIGLYFRLRMPETKLFLAAKQTGEVIGFPLLQSLKKNPLLLVKAILLAFLPALVLYLGFIYMPTYLSTYTKLPLNVALTINTVSMIFVIFGLPLVGYISDKIGRKPILLASGIICCLVAYPLFSLGLTGEFVNAIIVQFVFVILLALSYALLPVTLVEMVPTNIRYSTTAFAYNMGNSIFGGTAPLVATFFIKVTHTIMAPAFYLIVGGVVMVTITCRLTETYKQKLR